MALGSCARRSFSVNPPADLIREQDELGGQGTVQGFNAESDEASTEAFTFPKALTLPFVPSSTKDFFTKFIKVFMETTPVQAEALAEPQKQPFKV